MNKKVKFIVGLVLSLGAGIAISLIPPPEMLTRQAMVAMGIIVAAILLLTFETFPLFVTTILMCSALVLFKAAEFSVAFGAFAGTTFWLIIGVLGIGIAVNKSGLLKRVSYYALKLFPATFNGIVAALLGVGTILQPSMPSTSAKQSIMAPLAMGIGETLGFEKRSKPMAGLFNAMYVGWSITGTVFISASFLGYLFAGALPEDVRQQFSWGRWFIAMIPWAVIIVLGNYLAITKIYKPETKKDVTKEYINEQLKALGPITRDEKIVSIIMLITLALWITEGLTGISSTVTALLSLMAMLIAGVYTPKDFNTNMNWSLIFFIGGVLNISGVMSKLSITDWLGTIVEPLLGGLITKPYLFTLVLVVVLYLIRFVIVDLISPVILLTIVLTPVATSAGMSPWVVMMISYTSVCIWTTKYNNSNMLVGYAAAGGDENLDFKHVQVGAFAHLAVNLVALMVSIPYWQLLGYIQ